MRIAAKNQGVKEGIKPFDNQEGPADISKMSDKELVDLQLNDNDWYVRHARRILQERSIKSPGDPKLAQRAIEPIDVRSLIYQLAVTYAHHLVDTVGELVTAILDMNAGVAMIDVAAVDVRIARHERSPPHLSQPVRR